MWLLNILRRNILVVDCDSMVINVGKVQILLSFIYADIGYAIRFHKYVFYDTFGLV